MVESAEDNDAFTGHKHEVLGFGGWIVDKSGACANAALLKGEAGPCVESVCVHCGCVQGWGE